MEYMTLGQTDLQVSRVGFGCWAIGGYGWGSINDDDSIRAIRRALELGVNFFDTADVYGFGHSEEILSKALSAERNKVHIATKFGVSWNAHGATERDISPQRVVAALEGSLKRLKLDSIPLWQIHWPDGKTPIGATMAALARCQESGKIRYIGCSNFTPELILEAQNYTRIESLQAPYNLVDVDIETQLLEQCRGMRMGVVAYSPLAQGLLTGESKENFTDGDIRTRSKYFREGNLQKNLFVVSTLRNLADSYNKTPAQIAIRWILDNPLLTCAIPGIRNVNQIEENAGAAGWHLSQQDWKLLSSQPV